MDLRFTLPEHANMTVTTNPTEEGDGCTKDIVISGIGLDDLVYLRDEVQTLISGYRIKIIKAITGE